MQIPLPRTLSGTPTTPKHSEVLRNCYYSAGNIPVIRSRPVANSVATMVGVCRATGVYREQLYVVSNDRLVMVAIDDESLPPSPGNITITDIGEIPGVEQCIIAASFTQMLVLRIAGPAYVYDATNGLREITDTNFDICRSASYDPAGNWVFVPYSGEPFFFCSDASLLADPSSAGFRFADAQEFTDSNRCVVSRRRQIYVGGSKSFERLIYNPEIDTYTPIAGASSPVGYVGGLVSYEDTFMWIGNGYNGGHSVFIMSDTAKPVNNEYIDSLLSGYSEQELSDVRASSFRWRDQSFAIFYLPNETIVFNGGWSVWESGTSGKLSIGYICCEYGYTFAASGNGPSLYTIGDGSIEDGGRVTGEIQTFFRTEERSGFLVKRVFLSANPGVNVSGQTVALQVSTDGVTYSDNHYITIGDSGRYNVEMSWGPIGTIRDYLGLRFSWNGFINIAVDGIAIE